MPLFFEYFLAIWHDNILQLYVAYFPCPSPRISPFWKESWFLLLNNGIYSSPVFLMMYSAYELNKQGDNIQSFLPEEVERRFQVFVIRQRFNNLFKCILSIQ